MKLLIVSCLFFVAANGLPAKDVEMLDNSDESFFILPLNRHHNHKKEVPSVVEVEVGDSDESTGFFPSYLRPFFFNPFSFMSFGFPEFFSRPSFFDSIIPKDVPDATIKNSTSTTKVVDGHKITVNDTIYENDKNGAVYRFHVVEIMPADSSQEKGSENKSSEEKDVKTEASPAEVDNARGGVTEKAKPDQNSQDNEIQKEEMLLRIGEKTQGPFLSIINDADAIDAENRRADKRDVDLSGDIRVNRILSENGRRGGLFMVPPEVEVFDSTDIISEQHGELHDQQQVLDPYGNQVTLHPKF